MAVSATLKDYLDSLGVAYEVARHPREVVSTRIARTAHIPGDRLAKAVLLSSERGHILALVPATRHVDLSALSARLGMPVGLAPEDEVEAVFTDCEPGAIPACGDAYGIPCLMDDELADVEDVYFEAGDHVSLIHMKRDDFVRLMDRAERAPIATAH